MTTFVQKIINELSDESLTYDATVTQNGHSAFFEFSSEEECDSFIDAVMKAVDVERSGDYHRHV